MSLNLNAISIFNSVVFLLKDNGIYKGVDYLSVGLA